MGTYYLIGVRNKNENLLDVLDSINSKSKDDARKKFKRKWASMGLPNGIRYVFIIGNEINIPEHIFYDKIIK